MESKSRRFASKLFKEHVGEPELHKLLDEYDIEKVKATFEKEEDGQLNSEQLQKVLMDTTRTVFDPTFFLTTFQKMNVRGNGKVNWDEFVSFLILCFKDEEVPTEFKDLDPPISRPLRLLRSNHRHPINRILFSPTVKPDRSQNWSEGSYMTSSKDGVINYWSLDLQVERTVQSTCPELKVQQTWVLDMVCLPDVSVVCTSSSERDLRFYDTSARKFELRVMITLLEYAVVTLHYEYSVNVEEESMLFLGDMHGNIKTIFFSPMARGPFKSTPGVPLLNVRYEAVLKGQVPGFRVLEFNNIHTDWVQQISYYHTLHSFVSCAMCEKVGLTIRDFSHKATYVYNQSKGVRCFTIDETAHLIATGGPDCLVRIWNTFVPKRPTITFTGHHAGILCLIFQEGSKTLCSISKDKCIKVWDVASQTCLQSYLGLPSELGERNDLTYLYNPESRQIIIGNMLLAAIYLCPLQSGEHTDGNTHSSAVSCLLYNPLFNVLVTCGLDNYIIVWDPWRGRRISVVKECHTKMLHGEKIPVEITAATFNPTFHFLLTGAHDGSLKVWDFNTGTCLRNMRIETGSEVTSVIWIPGRILAMGWNQRVVEFADSGGAAGPGGAFSKPWQLCHYDDILCAAARIPQTLVTASYSGELVMWRLETGQPYKKHDVYNPTERIKIKYQTDSNKARLTVPRLTRHKSLIAKDKPLLPSMLPRRRVSSIKVPDSCVGAKGLAVRAVLFLASRPMAPNIGSLLIATDNGSVQVWSHHISGGFMAAFWATHTAGDYVIAMATDESNDYVFVGLCTGYIKAFLMRSYCTTEKKHISMPYLRITFPFLWKTLFDGKAKRSLRNQPLPMLVNSYRAHRMIISKLVYMDKTEILFSSSADFSVRMWTKGGRYLGTIGTFKPWTALNYSKPIGEDHVFIPLPPDIERVASSTTLRVLTGGQSAIRKYKKKVKKISAVVMSDNDTNLRSSVYGRRLEDPILGNYFKLPNRNSHFPNIKLDTSFSYIPVYQHLIRPPTQPFEIPKSLSQCGRIKEIIFEEREPSDKESDTDESEQTSFLDM